MDTERVKEIELYILELENSKYYVGQSVDTEKRIKAHFNGKGSAWTKLHRPVKVIKRWNTGLTDWKVAEVVENLAALSLMAEYGWRNVRGGFWSETDEINTLKNLQHHKQLIESHGFAFEIIVQKIC